MKCYNYFIDGYYIPNKLDETLTDELLKKIELNDKSSYEQLIVHNIRFVIDIVNKYFYNVQEDKDELVAIGIVGLIKGIKSFDLSKNVKLATYASKCIKNELLCYVNKNRRCIKADSINDDNIYERVIDDINLEEDYIEKERYKILNIIVNNLPEREKEIIKMYFGFYSDIKYNQIVIAKKFNLSQSYVSKLIPIIVKKIGTQLEYFYEIDAKYLEQVNVNKKLS